MRLASLIRFGTEHYPEKIARRLRGVTISCWLGALVTGGTTLSPLTPGLWKAHLIDGVAALVFMLAPLLHRRSSLAAPIVAILTAYTLIFAVTIFYGSGSGIYHFYQLFAPLVIVAVGVEHIRLAFGLVVLGIVMAIAAKVVAPVDSGVLSATLQFYDDIIVFIVAGSLIQFLIVLYAFRQVERSEAVAEREAERADAANKHKSHLIASASHDLRQPLHALNLFVARLRNEPDPVERNRLVTRIDASVASMNELFESLLDMRSIRAVVTTAMGYRVAVEIASPAMGVGRHQLGQSLTSPFTGRKKRRRSHAVSSRGTVCFAKSMSSWGV